MTLLETIEAAFVTAAATTIAGSGAAIAVFIRAHIKNLTLANLAVRAEQLGAGVAYDALTTAVANGAPDWAAAKKTAVTEGMAAVQTELKTEVTATAVSGALGVLLAADPTVTASPVINEAAVVAPVSIAQAAQVINDTKAALASLAPAVANAV